MIPINVHTKKTKTNEPAHGHGFVTGMLVVFAGMGEQDELVSGGGLAKLGLGKTN